MSGINPGMMVQSLRRDRDVVDKKLTRETLRRVVGFAHPHRIPIYFLLVTVAADAALVIVNPLLIAKLLDDGVLVGDSRVVISLALMMAGVSIVDALLKIASGYLSALIGEGLILDLRNQVFGHVQRMSMSFFTKTKTGALVSRLNNDVLGAQRAFTSTLSSTLSSVVSVLVVGIAMLALSWQITLLCLTLFPLVLFVSRIVGQRLSGATRSQMDANADLSTLMTERFTVGGAMLLKLFGRQKAEDELYASRAKLVRDAGVEIALITRIFTAAVLLIPALATALAYGVGGQMVINGALTVGTLTALATLMLRLLGPLQSLSNVRVDVMTALVSFDRIFEVLDLKPSVTEKPFAVEVPEDVSRVVFDDVHFSYSTTDDDALDSLQVVGPSAADQTKVLNGVSFTANPGDMVAIVGPSGAGKSTLTNLVARLYDVTDGSVRLGNGVDDLDVRDVQLESLEQQVGYVTQDAHMFHDSIRGNLRYAKPNATDEEIWQSLEDAQIASLVRAMPDGLDTVVGERGYRLSGGERQRMAIARLLLKAPPIVVLDEATAHLDSESEYAVQQALTGALQGRTSLVIAHRLSTVRNADQVLVLNQGQIEQHGTHDELMAQGGLYAELYRTQFQVDAQPADQQSVMP